MRDREKKIKSAVKLKKRGFVRQKQEKNQ